MYFMKNIVSCMSSKSVFYQLKLPKDSNVIKMYLPTNIQTRNLPSGLPGEGAGKGGGAGGTIRESGGGLGKYGAAKEEEYFYKHQREQLEKLKQKLKGNDLESPQSQQKEDK